MQVFDDLHRTDDRPASFSEAHYSYLNRSSRHEFAAARAIIQHWFDQYPFELQPELLPRLRSQSDYDHQAAVFELGFYFLLISLRAQVMPHPQVPSSSRRPDFLVVDPSGGKSYVETALVTFTTRVQKAEEARRNVVYDILNRLVKAPTWFLWLEIRGAPRTPPPAREIARFVSARLADLNPASVAATYEAREYDGLPTWPFSHDDWHINFRPIPRNPAAPPDPDHRPLGVFSGGFEWVDHRTPLRDAILDKSGAYGELDYPLVVAIDALEAIDQIDVTEALFGKEQFQVSVSEASSNQPPQATPSRVLDGVWTLPSGPRNTRLSSVLITRQFYPWALSACTMRLYHNPWANDSYQSVLTQLPQAIPRQGRLEMVEGMSPDTLLVPSIHSRDSTA
jgi:hypothetical protein